MSLQREHHATAKSAIDGGWNECIRHTSLIFLGFKVEIFVDMIWEIVTGCLSRKSEMTSLCQLYQERGLP